MIGIVGDIGGTNARLRLIKIEPEAFYDEKSVIKSKNYDSSQYKSLMDVLLEFLKDVEEENRPQIACVGVAGPVQNNVIKAIANIKHWPEIVGHDYAKELKLHRFKLLNDFEASAYGLLSLGSEDFIKINHGKDDVHGIKVITGPGTGLGLCQIVPFKMSNDKFIYTAFPSEGGHQLFAPTSDLQMEYLKFLREELKTHYVGLENAFAGVSFPYSYKFFRQKQKIANPNYESIFEKEVQYDMDSEDFPKDFPTKQMMEYGEKKKDKICTKVFKLFLSIYEDMIGDIVVKYLPFGGIYLFGNITNQYVQYLQKPDFMLNYISNRSFLNEVYSNTPIYVIKKIDIGVEGAYVASKFLL